MRNECGVAVRVRAVVVALAAAVLGLHGTSAAAKEESQSKVTYSLDIPAQNLNDALQALALASGHRLVYSSEIVNGRSAPAVKGEYTTAQAVERLLTGTDLVYEVTADGLVVIRGRGSKEKPTATTDVQAAGGMRVAQTGNSAKSPDADTAKGTANSESPISKDSSELQEILVTARKRAENIRDVPISIAVLSADDISRRGLVSSSDYLRGIPGVNQVETGYNGGQSIVIRGIETSPSAQNFSSGTTYATYFGETPTTNSAGLNGGTNIDVKLVDIERVEVLRGPQGTAFGDSSLGGAIRTIPVSPKLNHFEGKLTAGYGNTSGNGDDNYNVRAVGNIPLIEGKLAIRAVGYQYQDSGSYRNFAGSSAAFQAGPATTYAAQAFAVDHDDVGSAKVVGGRIAGLFQANDELRLALNYLYQKNETDGVPLANSGTYQQTMFEIAPEQVRRGQTGGFSDAHISIVNPVAEYALGWGDLTATYSYSKSGSENAEPFSYLGLDYAQSAGSDGTHRENVGEIRLATHLDGAWNFLAGVFAQNMKDDVLFTYYWFGSAASNVYAPGQSGLVGTYIDRRELKQKSAYAEVYWRFLPAFTLTAGARYYDYDRTVGVDQSGPYLGGSSSSKNTVGASGVSPRANLSYKLNDAALLYAGYSEGFRLGKPQPGLAASVCDRNGDGIVDGMNTSIVSTRSLNSDEMKSYEIGTKFALLDRRLTVDADIFRMEWSGVPVRVLPPPPPVGCTFFFNANAGEARSDGVEFHANYRISDAWRADLSASRVHARLTNDVPALGARSGARLPGSPKVNANLGLQYGFDINGHKAFVRTDTVYVGDSYGDLLQSQSIRSDSYLKIDATAGMTIDRIDLSLFVRNSTNQDTYVFRGASRSVPAFYGYRLRPRTIGLQLDYSF